MTFHRCPPRRRRTALFASALLAASALATPALAQDAGAPHRQVDGEKILQLLVAKGVITKADADGIIAEATVAPAPAAAPTVVAGGVDGDTQTIPYIPETVRKQIKEELKTEMAAQAESEGWAKPGEVAEWTKRIKLSGDVRFREEGIFFDKGNARDIVNFSAINTGSPYNINLNSPGAVNSPLLNTTDNRNRQRLRARLGLDAKLTDHIVAQIRVATGNDTSPVTPNQSLGGGNGDFSKYSIWLDRANIQMTPFKGLTLVLGRAANPFWTTELVFDDDLNFDGISLAAKGNVSERLGLFGTAGAFPTYNTDLNFGSRDVGAFKSNDRWLLAAQAGAEFKIAEQAKLTAAAGYYHFTAMQGRTSSPCLFNEDTCDTDNTRPLFQQYGNTVFPIRNITPDPSVPSGLSPEPQYFGLASKFHVIEAHGALDLNYLNNVPVRLEGEFIKNLGFDKAHLIAVQSNVVGPYTPSGTGWFANLMVGTKDPGKWGEWNVFGGYKRIGTDAMVDGLVDSDFHMGGTNAKGYILGGAFGIGGGTKFGVRWLSADQITGQPYSVDVLQIDLTAKF
jgi:hypothetical protein